MARRGRRGYRSGSFPVGNCVCRFPSGKSCTRWWRWVSVSSPSATDGLFGAGSPQPVALNPAGCLDVQNSVGCPVVGWAEDFKRVPPSGGEARILGAGASLAGIGNRCSCDDFCSQGCVSLTTIFIWEISNLNENQTKKK